MIGQVKLSKRLLDLILQAKFPSFCILTGTKGSGKKLMANNIVGWLLQSPKYPNDIVKYILGDVKVDTIRNMIEDAYTTKDFTVMIIPDADDMSLNAKNALLKITEEPPKNVIFIMTLSDISNTLETIKSRATVFQMDKYSLSEIFTYSKMSNENSDLISVCETPGEVDLLIKNGIKELDDFVELVIDNIAVVEPANAFKSSGKLALKSEEGFDLTLFWKVFVVKCAKRMDPKDIENALKYGKGLLCTSEYIKRLNKVGVNKQQCYDMWVFDIRKVWIDGLT